MIKETEKLLFRFEKEDKEYIDNFDFKKFYTYYERIQKFFSYPYNLPMIRICFLYGPEEYSFFTGDNNFKEWKVGMTGNNTTIYVFAPSAIEKHTTHKKEEVLNIIIHELTHLFYGYSKLFNLPMINEGIAKFFQNGLRENLGNLELDSLKGKGLPKYDYIMGHTLISGIIKKFGEEEAGNKLMTFIRSVNNEDTEENLFIKFKDVFDVTANVFIEIEGGIKNENVNIRKS